MNKLTIDPTLQPKFENLDDPLELCDSTGRTLAVVLPPELYERWLYDWAKSQFTDEELEKARQESGGYTTAEAIAYVERFISENGPSQ